MPYEKISRVQYVFMGENKTQLPYLLAQMISQFGGKRTLGCF